MSWTEHVDAIADATEQLISLPRRRAEAVAAAHDEGLSYPAMHREVYLVLRRRGVDPSAIEGAGIGPDNLRKMGAAD